MPRVARLYLTKKPCSQSDLADMLGVSVRTVRGWIRASGKTHREMPEIAKRMIALIDRFPEVATELKKIAKEGH